MTADVQAEKRAAAPPLPRSIWVVAWSSVVAQVVRLLDHGVRTDDEVSIVVSVLLGAVVVGWVSAGVVRARTVRLVLAWAVLLLGALGEFLDLVTADDSSEAGAAALYLALTAVTIAALAAFSRSDWYLWQRQKPPASLGAPISRLVAVGVLVGVLGALLGTVDDGFNVQFSVDG